MLNRDDDKGREMAAAAYMMAISSVAEWVASCAGPAGDFYRHWAATAHVPKGRWQLICSHSHGICDVRHYFVGGSSLPSNP